MTLIGRIITDQIRVDPSNPRHPRSIIVGKISYSRTGAGSVIHRPGKPASQFVAIA